MAEQESKEKLWQSVAVLGALIGAIWAFAGAMINAIAILNERRDVVITGELNGSILSPDHRQHIIWFDWVSSQIIVIVICAVFAVVIWSLGGVIGSKKIRIASLLVALIPALFGAGLALTSLGDLDIMMRAIADAGSASSASD